MENKAIITLTNEEIEAAKKVGRQRAELILEIEEAAYRETLEKGQLALLKKHIEESKRKEASAVRRREKEVERSRKATEKTRAQLAELQKLMDESTKNTQESLNAWGVDIDWSDLDC